MTDRNLMTDLFNYLTIKLNLSEKRRQPQKKNPGGENGDFEGV